MAAAAGTGCLDAIGSDVRCASAWRERSWAMSSDESLAALTARVVGIVRRAAAKAPIASCSREPCIVVSVRGHECIR